MHYRTKREKFELLRSQLENERSSFFATWRDCADYILPRRPRFFVSDSNKGDRRNQKIIDSTGTLAARTLRAGMMSGVTSPARDWFRLTTPEPELAEFGNVKIWLDLVSQRMRTVFIRSNLYNALPIIYGDLGVFGTACMLVEEDFQDVVRFYPFPIGSYKLSNNDRLKVDVFQRDFQMTVRQIVDRFGKKLNGDIDWDVFSLQIKNLYEQGLMEEWVQVSHVIMPNEEYDPKKPLSKYKKYTSCYYETGFRSSGSSNYLSGEPDQDKFLSEKGYDFFPILAPRWEVTGEDVYGTTCPGIEALGDIKQLQLGERRGMQAIEKMINPPMTAPTSLRNSKASILPSDVTFVDVREGQQGFRPAHEVNFRIDALENKQQQVRQRISRTFFEDLFLMLANSDRRQITAREIDERHEEKLLALGPVLEQLNQDLLDPLIDICFDIMNRQGLIPPAPDELQGMPLKVEYISIMAQAQKLVGIAGIERFAGFVGNLVANTQQPSILDKVDLDQMIDEYGDAVSVPAKLVRSDDAVEEIRAQRAKQQQAQAQAEQAAISANAAKQLSETNLEGDSALTRLIDQSQAGALV